MKYFLTGATGFVGSALARQLLAAGHKVHALVRSHEKGGRLRDLGARLFPGDVTNKESMRPGMLGVDGVFHVAGWYKIGTRDQSDGERVNVGGTRNVLELMGELGIPKGVYTSTLGVYSDTHGRIVDETYHFSGRHLTEYDRTKAAAHELALKSIADGLPLVIAMPGVNYGPGDTSFIHDILRDYLRHRLPMVPSGTGVCWAHVDDTAQGHILAMDKGRAGESYHLSGEPATLVDVLKIANEITGIPVPPVVPPGMLRALSYPMGVVERILALPGLYTAEGMRIAGGVTYWGDNSKARRELRYDPRPLRAGLRETLLHEKASL